MRLNPRKIIPGHGPVCGTAEAKRFIRYLEELDRNSTRAAVKGLSPEERVSRAIPRWSQGWKMRRLVEAYLRKRVERESDD